MKQSTVARRESGKRPMPPFPHATQRRDELGRGSDRWIRAYGDPHEQVSRSRWHKHVARTDEQRAARQDARALLIGMSAWVVFAVGLSWVFLRIARFWFS